MRGDGRGKGIEKERGRSRIAREKGKKETIMRQERWKGKERKRRGNKIEMGFGREKGGKVREGGGRRTDEKGERGQQCSQSPTERVRDT